MSQIAIPDTSRWLEAKNLARIIKDKNGNLICVSRYFLHFDENHLKEDGLPRKLKCLDVYFFGIFALKVWNVFENHGGKIKIIEYVAILNSKNNTWVTAELNQLWKDEFIPDEKGNIIGVRLTIQTNEGIQSVYFPNQKLKPESS